MTFYCWVAEVVLTNRPSEKLVAKRRKHPKADGASLTSANRMQGTHRIRKVLCTHCRFIDKSSSGRGQMHPL